MICIDTTVLIDEFRARGAIHAPVNQALIQHRHEKLIVPVIAAGEYLDGAAMISPERVQSCMAILRSRHIAEITLDISELYAAIVSTLRTQKALGGRSHNDLWIAATARRYGSRLLTRNVQHFEDIPGLDVISY